MTPHFYDYKRTMTPEKHKQQIKERLKAIAIYKNECLAEQQKKVDDRSS